MRPPHRTHDCSAIGVAALASLLLGLAACARPPSEARAPLDRSLIPEPILDARPDLIALYWSAWEHVGRNVRETATHGLPYLDEGAEDGTVWIWDSVFMAQFCRYAPRVCPGIQTLDLLYAILHDGLKDAERVEHADNPPIFAWAEWAHYQATADLERLKWLLETKAYLQTHYEWFERARREGPLGYTWSGNPSGMDNTPRGRGAGGHDGIYWFDAAAQQALSARLIARMASAIGRADLRAEYENKHAELRGLLDALYWDEADGAYYDVARADPASKSRVMTPAMFWPALAGASSGAQIARLAEAALDPWRLGGDAPFPSLSRSDDDFDPEGRYWRGGVWLPMAYLGTRALTENGHLEAAAQLGGAIVELQSKTYARVAPHTLWESYSPSRPRWSTNGRGAPVRPDFTGWSALGPIAIFIEQVLGFHTLDAPARRIEWRKSLPGRHGLRRLRLGPLTTDILGEDGFIEVRSDGAYTLVVNGVEHAIRPGLQRWKEGAQVAARALPAHRGKVPPRSFVVEGSAPAPRGAEGHP